MREEALAQRSNGGPAPAAAEGGAAAAAPAPLPYAAPGLPPIAAVPQLWDALAALHGDAPALVDPHAHPPQQYSFAQVAALVRQLAAGLAGLGLCKGDAVVLFSENSAKWLLADQAVQACGAADAVRGVASSLEELAFILGHSRASGLIVQDAAALDRLLPALAPAAGDAAAAAAAAVRWVVVLHGEPSAGARAALAARPLLSFEELAARGREGCGAWHAPELSGGDVATYIYTSGTSGQPKGVVLTHANIMYQINYLRYFIDVKAGRRTLSLLPPWHVYERSVAYYVLSSGVTQVFTNIRKFREDLQKYPPDYFICVPLVLDTLYSKVIATLKKASALRRTLALGLLAAAAAYTRARRVVEGTALAHAAAPRPAAAMVAAWLRLALLAPLNWLAQVLVVAKVRAAIGIREAVISGGGSLAAHLDDFYESIGLPVLNGWGLTETSPVLACRRTAHNVRGSVGYSIPGTQLRFVDPETFEDVPDGQQGLILARGPGVMSGYHNDAAATAAAFSAGDGWFSTGDLGWRAPTGVPGSAAAGCIVLTGRAKDTIVLTSGENVEPQLIEDALCCSPYIKFAMLLGQGHRALGALITTDADALADLASKKGVPALSEGEVRDLVGAELRRLVANRVRWEHVAAFTVVGEPFSVDNNCLTRTMKLRRAAILEHYEAEVAELEGRLR